MRAVRVWVASWEGLMLYHSLRWCWLSIRQQNNSWVNLRLYPGYCTQGAQGRPQVELVRRLVGMYPIVSQCLYMLADFLVYSEALIFKCLIISQCNASEVNDSMIVNRTIKGARSSLLQLICFAILRSPLSFHLLLDLCSHLYTLFVWDDHSLTPLVAAGQLGGTQVRVENRKLRFLFHLIIIPIRAVNTLDYQAIFSKIDYLAHHMINKWLYSSKTEELCRQQTSLLIVITLFLFVLKNFTKSKGLICRSSAYEGIIQPIAMLNIFLGSP